MKWWREICIFTPGHWGEERRGGATLTLCSGQWTAAILWACCCWCRVADKSGWFSSQQSFIAPHWPPALRTSLGHWAIQNKAGNPLLCGGETPSYSRHPLDGQNQNQQINIVIYFCFEHHRATEVCTLQVTDCNALFSFINVLSLIITIYWLSQSLYYIYNMKYVYNIYMIYYGDIMISWYITQHQDTNTFHSKIAALNTKYPLILRTI